MSKNKKLKNKIYESLKKINDCVPKKYELYIGDPKEKLNMQILKKIKEKQQIKFKPSGIWVSGLFERNQNSWTDWAFSENMLEWIDPEKLSYYAIKIIDNPKLILKLNTIKKIQRFHKKYSVEKDNYFMIDWKNIEIFLCNTKKIII